MDPRSGSLPSGAIHTVLLLDCSTSIETAGLVVPIVDAVNKILARLVEDGGLVSIIFFNAEVGVRDWRRPAREVIPLSRYDVPTDYGTHLYTAIGTVIDRLVEEYDASQGETNAEVELLIFTDGEDSSHLRIAKGMDAGQKKVGRMDAHLALGRARNRHFVIRFVTSVEGLAGSLGITDKETIPIAATPAGVTRGFTLATIRMPCVPQGCRMPTVPPTTPDAAQPSAPKLPETPTDPPGRLKPAKRPWWRWW